MRQSSSCLEQQQLGNRWNFRIGKIAKMDFARFTRLPLSRASIIINSVAGFYFIKCCFCFLWSDSRSVLTTTLGARRVSILQFLRLQTLVWEMNGCVVWFDASEIYSSVSVHTGIVRLTICIYNYTHIPATDFWRCASVPPKSNLSINLRPGFFNLRTGLQFKVLPYQKKLKLQIWFLNWFLFS
jgi:hypothetical protein